MQKVMQRRRIVVLCLTAALIMMLGAVAQSNPETTAFEGGSEMFPKIANIHIGRAGFYNDSIEDMARYDLLILAFWRDWGGGTDAIRSVLQRIKAINPDIVLGQYTVMNESSSAPGGANGDIYQKLSNEKGPGGKGDWWARDAAGYQVSSWPSTWNINFTRFTTPDANGDRFPEWLAKRNHRAFFEPIPEWDMWFVDNVFYRPRVWADWDGDGVNDDPNDPALRSAYMQGNVDHFKMIRELRPDLYLAANVDGPGDDAIGFLNDPEYKFQLDGALFEKAIGENWSFETWGTWEQTMRMYRHLMANTREPHLVIFNALNIQIDYKTARYIIASVLMDDGYVAISGLSNHSTDLWYDEYDLAGTASTKWLGRAIDPPQYEPWQNGVYMRRFENGMALVNPKGNGAQMVTIEPGYRRFRGNQDPVSNNGEPAQTITLAERDGILLVKDK